MRECHSLAGLAASGRNSSERETWETGKQTEHYAPVDPGSLFPTVRAYATAADTRSPDCFIGASPIRATPMILSAATANSNSPRSLAM